MNAGAIASCTIILFARVAHGKSAAPTEKWWHWAHYACVISAWLGLTVTLSVLGPLMATGQELEGVVNRPGFDAAIFCEKDSDYAQAVPARSP